MNEDTNALNLAKKYFCTEKDIEIEHHTGHQSYLLVCKHMSSDCLKLKFSLIYFQCKTKLQSLVNLLAIVNTHPPIFVISSRYCIIPIRSIAVFLQLFHDKKLNIAFTTSRTY